MRVPRDIYANYGLSRIHSDWANLVAQDYRLSDDTFRTEALSFATQIMHRAKDCLLRIVDRLHKEDYRFVYPDKVLVESEQGVMEWIQEFRRKGVHLPVALEAWLREVGSVNLMGSHPKWPKPAYFFDGEIVDGEPIYTDPLVVELSRDYVEYLYEEWTLDQQGSASELAPFRLDIAPDHIHKANVSGGLPYQLPAERPAIDAIVLNERHGMTLTAYIRMAIRWGGFPGFDYITDNEVRQTWRSDESILL